MVLLRPRWGKHFIGKQVVDNIPLYFYPNGVQAKDAFVVLDGNSYYFQKDSSQMVQTVFGQMTMETGTISDKEGKLVTGEQSIDGSICISTQTVSSG